ncbi:DNA alkylation repair protein [Paenibacillus apiarius]|uniref:DNA alkylation repair protein n=1 Tax=Paenibacillus apiarius TaxID=46240 RepID=A0ABT4DQA8_9BACL|nr:DNA alkylation repair protein [Paenibacillus apiarius]MCY9514014.1 DNA alkylation repair protein [Paenibacillus apiarius]MCY9519531.1 DNA alkylation repair protein [Paenibacillus apiarius]MCY9552458.1 DNA alkylation repair protein [Paenibacillus apiarius]MCY9556287.1 DNA alkylation repair protein [Paenibacillus apiarius]MCY9681821.1 DNA alkylation repair protein [Paenibacillus apiarius]
MAEALKEMYNLSFFQHFCAIVNQAHPEFDDRLFLNLIFDQEWENRELKQRIRHIAHALSATLPPSYPDAIQILAQITPQCRGFEYLFFPDFVEEYGLAHWDVSISALKQFTASSSSEFAVRPFIQHDPIKMMSIMEEWARDEDHHVRRLASEGCRPRLPWAAPLNMFKDNPAPILPILTLLKEDESEYVRKSVANNLNDISKDHPGLVKKIGLEWKGQHPHTDWIIKHGCRTLLRKADPEVLRLFGFHTEPDVQIKNLLLSCDQLSIGDTLAFDFVLVNPSPDTHKLRIEYGIYFVKANGSTSRKLFKITENSYNNGEVVFHRTHSFKDLSTRTHYEGQHRICIAINGREMAEAYFQLNASH